MKKTHHLVNIMIFKKNEQLQIKTNILKPVYRERGPVKSRLKYLRLDKNERISNFERNIQKYCKKIQI